MNCRQRKRKAQRLMSLRRPRYSAAAHAWTHRLQQLEEYRQATAPLLLQAFVQAYMESQRSA